MEAFTRKRRGWSGFQSRSPNVPEKRACMVLRPGCHSGCDLTLGHSGVGVEAIKLPALDAESAGGDVPGNTRRREAARNFPGEACLAAVQCD